MTETIDENNKRLKEGLKYLKDLVDGKGVFVMSEFGSNTYGASRSWKPDEVYTYASQKPYASPDDPKKEFRRIEHVEHVSVYPSDTLIAKLSLVFL